MQRDCLWINIKKPKSIESHILCFSNLKIIHSGELAELTVKLAHAADGERRAQEQLSTRNEEQAAEVSDLQNEVSWFRGEYDQLLKKVRSEAIC